MKYVLPLLLFTQIASAQNARDYYNQLVKAGGLDHPIPQYACFDDDASKPNFFTLSKIQPQDAEIEKTGRSKPSLHDRNLLKKGFIAVLAYDHGVALGDSEILFDDHGSFVDDEHEINKTTPIRIRYSIQWTTLRYKHSVEVLNADLSLNFEKSGYGHCEALPLRK